MDKLDRNILRALQKDARVKNADLARKLMLAHPAIIKRPLLEIDSARYLGFSDVHYTSLFSKTAP